MKVTNYWFKQQEARVLPLSAPAMISSVALFEQDLYFAFCF